MKTHKTGAVAGKPDFSPDVAALRFAHLAPKMGSDDFCIRPVSETSWSGPSVIGPLFRSFGDGDEFYFPGVSVYFEFLPAKYQIRLVAGNATDCTTANPKLPDSEIVVVGGQAGTIALTGDGLNGAYYLVFFTASAPPQKGARVLVANAMTNLAGPVDFVALTSPETAIGTSQAKFTTGVVELQKLSAPFAARNNGKTFLQTPSAVSVLDGGMLSVYVAGVNQFAVVKSTLIVCNDLAGGALVGTKTIADASTCSYAQP